jgi:type II secretory pathway component PulC
MTNTNDIAFTAPGVNAPVVSPYPEGAYSPRTAGIVITNNNNDLQSRLIGAVHGGKRYKKNKLVGGNTSKIAVPTMQVHFPEQGAGNQTVNGNITGTTKLGANTATNSVFDACIGQPASCTTNMMNKLGGSIKYKRKYTKKRGGVKWGCYSGGKSKRKNKRTKSSKKNKKRSKRNH